MSVLRRIVALLLLFVMMFCITKNSALHTFYMLNTDGFISLFCENIEKPALKCNGKCQLSKMVKEQQKEQAEKVLLNLQQEVFLCHQINCSEDFPMVFVSQITIAATVFPKNHYAYLYYFRNDKPPQILS
ncbi:MAG: hypothetical protein REI64_18050 [Pedobacter sp.]|uniref:hypothetical protein n=1 Tax=Pedobacter sp. TaxID=1411316 RepID=UPI00280711AC|nr:hypothetical protein [Pedobacter sp.]MDQ8006713.1 hypothetical protein [Pedobacter sp.]